MPRPATCSAPATTAFGEAVPQKFVYVIFLSLAMHVPCLSAFTALQYALSLHSVNVNALTSFARVLFLGTQKEGSHGP